MSDEIELSLGLSLNGRFGTDPNSKSNKILERWSSSAPGFLEVSRECHVEGLGRTCSLPLEREEETRKRKEVQMLRRMEVKRKMSVKQRVSCKKFDNDDDDEEMRIENVVRVGNSGRGFGSMDRIFKNDEYAFRRQTPSPGTRSNETKSPQSVFSFTEKNEYHPTHHSGSATMKASGTKPSQTSLSITTELKQSQTSLRPQEMIQDMANMPCVSTKPNGPNGKRVEGFLYGYRKGEEVRIICVCHGSSLSPAEFIKHGGGGDVEHPLRHIVVNPSPCSSFARTRECLAMSKTF